MGPAGGSDLKNIPEIGNFDDKNTIIFQFDTYIVMKFVEKSVKNRIRNQFFI